MNEETNEQVKSRRPLWIRGIALFVALLLLLEVGIFNASTVRFLREDYAGSDYESMADYLYENDGYLTADRLRRMRAVLRLLGTPDTFDEYYLAASVAIADENYSEAARHTEKCVELYEGSDRRLAELYVRLGCLYGLEDDWRSAGEAFSEAYSLDRENSSAILMLVESYLRQGEYVQALEAMETYGQAEPLSAAQLNAVATMQLSLGKTQEAIESCTAALDMEDADRAELLYLRAQAYLSLGETAKALADAQAYAEAGGSEDEAATMQAIVLEDAEDYAGALQVYLQMIERGEAAPGIYELAIERAYLIGDYETMLTLCEQVRQLELSDEVALPFIKWSGVARLELGAYDEALKDIAAYLEKVPENPEILYLRGLAYMGTEHYRSAIGDFTAAMASEELMDKCLYNRALCWLLRDNSEKATADFSTILERNADPEAVAMTRALLGLDGE